MPVDPELLEILACTNCKTKVELVKNGTALKCGQCKRVYPIKDDIDQRMPEMTGVEFLRQVKDIAPHTVASC